MLKISINAAVLGRVISKYDIIEGVQRKRKKMHRQHPTFPAFVTWHRTLEAKYAHVVAKCKVCPHRGISLVGAPIRNGAYVCPGHGLAWDKDTLALKPRPQKA